MRSLPGKIVEIIPACQFVVNIDIGIQVKSISPGFDGLGSIYGKLGDHMTGPRSGNSSCQITDSDTWAQLLRGEKREGRAGRVVTLSRAQ